MAVVLELLGDVGLDRQPHWPWGQWAYMIHGMRRSYAARGCSAICK